MRRTTAATAVAAASGRLQPGWNTDHPVALTEIHRRRRQSTRPSNIVVFIVAVVLLTTTSSWLPSADAQQAPAPTTVDGSSNVDRHLSEHRPMRVAG